MLPLSGLRVIDWTTAVAGPFGGMVMADLGAEVIHISRVGSISSGSPADCGRNKKSLSLDVTAEDGKEVLRKLIKTADIFLENFSFGATDEMGFSYEEVLKLNPHIIYIALKGYGDGPYERRPAYDPDIEAETGILRLSGLLGGEPVRLPGSIIDKTTGIWCAFYAILAVMQREATGKGQYIKVGMYEDSALLASQNMILYQLYNKLLSPAGMGISSTRYYETLNSWVYLAVHSDDEWTRFCSAFDVSVEDELLFKTTEARTINSDKVEKIIQGIFSKMTTENILAKLSAADVSGSPVNTMQEVIADKHLNAGKSIVVLTPHPRSRRSSVAIPMLPFRSSSYNPNSEGWGGHPEPWNGQDTVTILSEIGYTADQIADLRKRRVVYPYLEGD